MKNKTFNELTIQEIKDRVAKLESNIEKSRIKAKDFEKRYNKILSDLDSQQHVRSVYIHRMRNIEEYEQPKTKGEKKDVPV